MLKDTLHLSLLLKQVLNPRFNTRTQLLYCEYTSCQVTPEQIHKQENRFSLTCYTRLLSEADVRLYPRLSLHLIWIWNKKQFGNICWSSKCSINPLCKYDPEWLRRFAKTRPTWVVRQVGEGDRIALHLVWDAPQAEADFNLVCEVLVLVRGGFKHDGDLPVHVRLGELPVRLPRPVSEEDLYVVCESAPIHRATEVLW